MISENQNIILLIISSILFMLVFAISIISAIAEVKEPRNKYPDFEGKSDNYNFVTCPNDPKKFIYPEGTSCDGLPDDYNDDADNHDSDEVTEDEEEAMKKEDDD